MPGIAKGGRFEFPNRLACDSTGHINVPLPTRSIFLWRAFAWAERFMKVKIMDYLTETQKYIFAMSEHKRLYRKIFANYTNQYYSKISQVHFFDGPSQRLAYVLCQQPIKIDLKQFQITFDNTNVTVNGTIVFCNDAAIAAMQIQDIDFIMKTRAENEIKRIQLKNPQPNLPKVVGITNQAE